MSTNNESNGKSLSTLKRIESALKCGIHFVEDEAMKAVSIVENGVETVLSPFELLYVFIRHECLLLEKTKLIVKELCDVISNLGYFIHGDPTVCGFISLLLWIWFCFKFEVWMIPLLIPYIFLRQFIFIHFNFIIVEIDNLVPDKKEEEQPDRSITEMLRELCDVCDSIDSGIEITASLIRTTKRTLKFKEPEICYLAILISMVAAVILYYISLSYFIILASIYSFTSNYLRMNGYVQEKDQ